MTEVNEIPKRVAVYIRVSTEEQVERFGIGLQKSAIESLIASKQHTDQSYVFAGEQYLYIDDGVSGTVELEERPAFSRLIEDVALAPEGAKPFDAVAVYRIDRFARKLKILLCAIDFFDQYDLQFVSVTESIDTSTPFGRAMLNIVGVIAELERDTIKDRTSAGREQAIKQGVHMGTGAPFGYKKDENKRLVILDEEAETVRLIFDLYVIQKKSVYEIADYLTENQYLTAEASGIKNQKHRRVPKAKQSVYRWHPENIRKYLSNEIYTGQAYYGKSKDGKKMPKNSWILYLVPQIIDDLTFEKAQRIAKQSKHGNKKKRSNHLYLLSGLLRCDHCKQGSSLKHFTGQPKTLPSGKTVHYYKCKGTTYQYKNNRCDTLPIGADSIEDYVIKLCKDLLSNPVHTFEYQKSLESTRLRTNHLRREEEQLLKLIEGIPERKEKLRYHHEINLIDSQKLKSDLDSVVESEKASRQKLSEIQAQLSQCNLSEGYIKTFKLFEKKYQKVLSSVDKNRDEVYRLVHLMIDEIIVYSRSVTEKDKVAGRKRERQVIANRIHVKFRLPQDMLNEIGAQKEVLKTELAPVSDASSSQKNVDGAR